MCYFIGRYFQKVVFTKARGVGSKGDAYQRMSQRAQCKETLLSSRNEFKYETKDKNV